MFSARRRFLSGAVLAALTLLGSCGCSSEREARAPQASTSLEPLWIDTRLPEAFAMGHVPGALNLQWDWDQLADRIEAYVPDRTRPILLRATNEAEERDALGLLADRGYTNVSAPSPPQETATLPLMHVAELSECIDAGEEFVLIDVRSGLEHLTGCIESSLRLDHDEAALDIGSLDRKQRYYVICEDGYRSSQLASWMRIQGFEDVFNVIDGMAAWRNR